MLGCQKIQEVDEQTYKKQLREMGLVRLEKRRVRGKKAENTLQCYHSQSSFILLI